MIVTVGDIHSARNSIEELVKQKDLPVKFKYWLAKLLRVASREVEDVEVVRLDLIDKLGESKPNGDRLIPPDRMGEFRKEMKKVLDQEVEITVKTFTLEEVGELLTSQQMAALWFMIKDETEN